ncbi:MULTISPECIES: thermonuclease family protein [Rhodopseudomonas]|uniref:Nuclease n=1 Tax=Rhodopseudomonas palustris TaxID=1076 RepID=A0A0D7F2V8_RHOPL|nr:MULTISPECIES: thermonuclease family protein [Rhodopseudomonas]KIZ47423.1 nuclease [Rhodopseudomonas palustris]MDF3810989.1 thermonuclease family protein [Rhodopseudomonas sp. BAL398]WOK15890.1 thermonuclease family protein [Rhodopseudomonas sp. BAL398]
MRMVLAILAMLLAHPSWALDAVVKDGSTLRLGGTTYRLAGVDAPEFDQVCVDQKADPWACGIEVRDRLAGLIGDRQVRCDDKGPEPKAKGRRSGVCTIAGETESINRWLVRQGWALTSQAGRFGADQGDARDNKRGLWKGCFAAPRDFRRWKTDATLLGAACRSDKQVELAKILFPDEPIMPPGCAIKGKLAIRARISGHVGVYHLRGCRNYAALSRPNRWFCSEDDARAAGFRRAYNCGRAKRR